MKDAIDGAMRLDARTDPLAERENASAIAPRAEVDARAIPDEANCPNMPTATRADERTYPLAIILAAIVIDDRADADALDIPDTASCVAAPIEPRAATPTRD